MQVDFMMPERLGAEYVAEDNTRKIPVMLHRAIVGSLERFIGILIEHYAERYPCGWPRSRWGTDDHRSPGGLCERGRRETARRRLQGDQRFAQRENNL
jgi:hypothetical protein